MTLVLTGVISHHLVVIISIKTQKSEIVLMIRITGDRETEDVDHGAE